MIIYIATNRINGKYYIGKTKFILNKRKKEHENDAKNPNKKNTLFSRSLLKYGFENFDWEILIDNINEKEMLNDLEVFCIADLSASNKLFGYNMTSGGDGGGFILEGHPNEHKIRKERSERVKGKNNYFYGVHLCGEKHPSWGKEVSLEIRKKQSEAKKKYFEDPENIKRNRLQKTCRSVEINGVKYPSINDAARKLNMYPSTIQRRAENNNILNYNFIKKD